MSEAIRLIGKNVADRLGGEYVKMSFHDLTSGEFEPADDRTGEEIALDVILGAGLQFEKGVDEIGKRV